MSVAGGFTTSFEANGERESHRGRTSSFLHYSSTHHNLIFYLRPVKQPLDSVRFQVSLAVFNKLGAENDDITFLCLIKLKVESKAVPFIAV